MMLMGVSTGVWIALAAVATLAACVACGVSIAVWNKLRKQTGGQDADVLDAMTENLQEAVKMIDETTEKTAEQTRRYLMDASTNNNAVMIQALQPYMDKFDKQIERLSERTEQQMQQIRDHMQQSMQQTRAETELSMRNMREDITRSLSEVRRENTENLLQVRNDNRQQLEQMRQTVDEKLTSTLDQRVRNAFQIVSERLDQVQRGFGEMRELSSQVGNLNRVFTNVKTRGGWGEVSLESLLEQMLSPEQYCKQFAVRRGSAERVDFAIIMPGQAGETVYLPVDAKFPLEDYEKLLTAVEHGTTDDIARARHALAEAVKTQAKSIASKYINPPKTTDFAILYLPTEGLCAEVLRDGALVSDLQAKYRVTVCGPTTISALLNSLQMGFNTLKIQKASGEVIKLMRSFRKDFDMFTGVLSKVRTNAERMIQSLDEVDKRNGKIRSALDKVQDAALPTPTDQAEIAATVIGTEGTDES